MPLVPSLSKEVVGFPVRYGIPVPMDVYASSSGICFWRDFKYYYRSNHFFGKKRGGWRVVSLNSEQALVSLGLFRPVIY